MSKFLKHIPYFLLSVVLLMTAHLTLADDKSPLVHILPKHEPEPQLLRNETEILTRRMIAHFEHIDESKRRQLSHEIEQVLILVRKQHPEIAEVTAVDYYVPGQIILIFDPQLTEVVENLVTNKSGMIQLSTGNKEFDELNVQMGLHTVRFLNYSKTFIFYFDPSIHPSVAVKKYRKLQEVIYADANKYLIDGSDLRMTKSNDTWYISVRKAWGDCPSGCIFEEIYYFSVDGNNVVSVPEEVAQESEKFVSLAGH